MANLPHPGYCSLATESGNAYYQIIGKTAVQEDNKSYALKKRELRRIKVKEKENLPSF